MLGGAFLISHDIILQLKKGAKGCNFIKIDKKSYRIMLEALNKP